jgi:hypothetical protein
MKKITLLLLLSFISAVTLFSTTNIASALPVVWEGPGNLKQKDLGYINSLIDDFDANLPDIDPTSWPTKETLYEGDTEFKKYLFKGLEGVNYLFVKSGNFSQLIYVGDVDSYHWTSPNGKALSNSATPASPVPEPGTLILLATGIIGTATVYRKKFSKK